MTLSKDLIFGGISYEKTALCWTFTSSNQVSISLKFTRRLFVWSILGSFSVLLRICVSFFWAKKLFVNCWWNWLQGAKHVLVPCTNAKMACFRQGSHTHFLYCTIHQIHTKTLMSLITIHLIKTQNIASTIENLKFPF